MHERTINNLSEMEKFATEIASNISGGEVLLLTGELGAGKTTFTQGLAKALGIKEQITSPTFTIASEYQITNHQSLKNLVHVDLYRLEENASQDSAVRQALEQSQDPQTITIIEWAERLGAAVPASALKIAFEHGDTENERTVTYAQ